MKAEKLSPRPTGSRIVKRTLEGGIAVSILNIRVWRTSTAASRAAPAAFSKSNGRSGNGAKAGNEYTQGLTRSRSSLGRPDGISARSTV